MLIDNFNTFLKTYIHIYIGLIAWINYIVYFIIIYLKMIIKITFYMLIAILIINLTTLYICYIGLIYFNGYLNVFTGYHYPVINNNNKCCLFCSRHSLYFVKLYYNFSLSNIIMQFI